MTRTRQEIFDIAYLGLKSQGFRRSGNDAECWYRGPDGLKCAVGYLIADEDYRPELEGCAAHDASILTVAKVGFEDRSFLDGLQARHDTASSPELMQKALREFAARHGLTIPEDNE